MEEDIQSSLTFTGCELTEKIDPVDIEQLTTLIAQSDEGDICSVCRDLIRSRLRTYLARNVHPCVSQHAFEKFKQRSFVNLIENEKYKIYTKKPFSHPCHVCKVHEKPLHVRQNNCTRMRKLLTSAYLPDIRKVYLFIYSLDKEIVNMIHTEDQNFSKLRQLISIRSEKARKINVKKTVTCFDLTGVTSDSEIYAHLRSQIY